MKRYLTISAWLVICVVAFGCRQKPSAETETERAEPNDPARIDTKAVEPNELSKAATTRALYSTDTTLASVNISAPVNASTITSSTSKDGLLKKYTETVTPASGGEITFDMVLIPGGESLMGSSDNETGRKKNEGPQHKVRIEPFYLCATETTYVLFQAYYEETVQQDRDEAIKKEEDLDAITGPTPIYGDPTMGMGGGTRPAIGLTWLNAKTFCRWLSKKTGKTYRLPTEAEWEYAARAGTETTYFFGNDPKQLADYAWFEDNSDQTTQEVAQKKPNPWGLYDMLGNVLEWTQDFYSPTAYSAMAKNPSALNPKGPKEGKVHVARGGSWESPAEELRCATRAFEEPFWRYLDPQVPKSKWWFPQMGFIGFRVARSIEPTKPK